MAEPMNFINQMEPWFDAKESDALAAYMKAGGWVTEFKKTREFEEEVRKFITESIISVIAVPSISEEEDAQALPNHPHLVPLDMASVFFVQQVQIKQRILERE